MCWHLLSHYSNIDRCSPTDKPGEVPAVLRIMNSLVKPVELVSTKKNKKKRARPCSSSSGISQSDQNADLNFRLKKAKYNSSVRVTGGREKRKVAKRIRLAERAVRNHALMLACCFDEDQAVELHEVIDANHRHSNLTEDSKTSFLFNTIVLSSSRKRSLIVTTSKGKPGLLRDVSRVREIQDYQNEEEHPLRLCRPQAAIVSQSLRRSQYVESPRVPSLVTLRHGSLRRLHA